jgi:hypothetical protein
MDNVVNLNRARKARTRAEREKQAAENRVRFGQTKNERQAQEVDRARREREFDGHKREE